jgi:hypothetical protein
VKANVSTADVLAAAFAARMGQLHTMAVGRVEAVNATARKVDVRLAMLRVLQDEEGGLQTEELPMLRQVPIGALRAGAARIDMPVAAGCWVCVMFFEDNIGKWLAQGGVSVSPGDVERHGLTGAVAVPLLYPDPETKTLPSLSATDIVLAIDDGPELRVTPDQVEVIGDLVVSGAVTAAGQVTAMAETTPVNLSTHLHNTAMGPSGPPNPGT